MTTLVTLYVALTQRWRDAPNTTCACSASAARRCTASPCRSRATSPPWPWSSSRAPIGSGARSQTTGPAACGPRSSSCGV